MSEPVLQWEESKENFVPIRSGRKVATLEVDVSSVHNDADAEETRRYATQAGRSRQGVSKYAQEERQGALVVRASSAHAGGFGKR